MANQIEKAAKHYGYLQSAPLLCLKKEKMLGTFHKMSSAHTTQVYVPGAAKEATCACDWAGSCAFKLVTQPSKAMSN